MGFIFVPARFVAVLKDVTINYDGPDNCPGRVTCSLDVSSGEPIKGTGDGDIAHDWEIIDSRHVRLRDEKTSKGGGRIYAVTVTCRDANGNSSSKAVTVSVPHTTLR
jgi:hypothetical protein